MRIFIFKLMRFFLRLFWLFPVENNRVVLTAYNGRRFGCNPKYLALALSNSSSMDVYFALKSDINVKMSPKIKRVNYRCLRHFWLLMTSKYIVFNSSGFAGILPYRKEQVIINTWHGGGCFKAIGIKVFKSREDMYYRAISGRNTTYFIATSKSDIQVNSESMLVDKQKFLPTGFPRNDLLFGDHPEIINKVRKYLGLERSEKIILYAPTYRDGPVKSIAGYDFEPLDVGAVINAMNKRFGGSHVFVFKAHHDMLPENDNKLIINASNYSDIQELLLAADVLITDYSTVQWDFALQRKPGFLYMPDLQEYMSVHPFSSDYRNWPYNIALTNAEIVELIKDYDETEGLAKIEEHFFKAGCFETGTATMQLLKRVFNL